MSPRPKGPKQQKKPDLPESPKQPYGEPLSGSHKDKMKKQSQKGNRANKGM